MWGGRHCREGDGRKAEMVWTCNTIRRNEGGLVKNIMELEIKDNGERRLKKLIAHLK